MLVSGNSAAAFSPSSLFAAGEQGVWYDPSDLTTMFEDAAGTTAVHTPGNGVADSPVGLLLDKHSGLVTATKHGECEGISGAYFSTPYKSISTADLDIKVRWMPYSFAAAAALLGQDAGGSTRNFILNISTSKQLLLTWWNSAGTLVSATSTVAASINANTTYWFRATLLANNGASGYDVKFYFNADTGSNTEPSSWTQLGSTVTVSGTTSIRSTTCASWVGANSATGTNNINGKCYFASVANSVGGSAVQTFTPTSYTSGATFTSTSSDVWTINGVARIVPDGNHGLQGTSTARPTLSARYNLLTYSEQFDNAAWTKHFSTVTANQTTAPDGTTTADLLTAAVVNQAHAVYTTNSVTIASGIDYLVSIYIKKNTHRYVYIAANGAGNKSVGAVFDLDGTSGAATQTAVGSSGGTYVSSSQENLSSGWRRLSVRFSVNSTTLYCTYGFAAAATGNAFDGAGNVIYSSTGTETIYIWGADVRAYNDGVGLPVYQRIADANTYDSVGFPYYIKSDGVDDSEATSAINFTGTNKITVFAGVRKLSDSAQSVVAELSSTIASNNGTFLLSAPNSAAANYNFSSKGTTQVDNTVTTYTAPISNIITGIGDIGAPNNQIRVNGSVAGTQTGTQGTGNYGNFALYLFRRNSATLPFNGRTYGLIIRGASSTSTEISNTETWLNGKAKAY